MTVLSNAWQLPARVESLFIAVTAAFAAIASATVADAQEGNRAVHPDFAQVHVMTRNVYDGMEKGDYSELTGACSNLDALSKTWAAINATDPVGRAALHASQIAREHPAPDLIAIQEAVYAQNGLTRVDMLSALLCDLARLGMPYKVIVAMKGLDIGSGNSIRISMWDAILVRSDLPSVVNDFKQGLYKDSYKLCPDTTLRRNWMFVDMQLGGHAFRFVTTHLDLKEAGTPHHQLVELLEVVGNTRLPVIVTGDFNQTYDDFTDDQYPGLAAAGYQDAWIEGVGASSCWHDNDGATWGQYPKGSPPKDSPWKRTEKIDLILLRGGVSATSAHLVGAMAPPCSPQACTLLASDHAGVVAGLIFTGTINSSMVSLLVTIGGTLLLAGLFLGVRRWLRRAGQ